MDSNIKYKFDSKKSDGISTKMDYKKSIISNINKKKIEKIDFQKKLKYKHIEHHSLIILSKMSSTSITDQKVKLLNKNNSTNIKLNDLKINDYNIVMEKTTSTNMNDNCKSAKFLGIKMFYNTVKSEEAKKLKKANKYTSPLNMATSIQKPNEITIKYDEEKGQKTWCKYGNIDFNELNEMWKTNNHLFEIIPTDKAHKMYFDIDKRYESEENSQDVLNMVYTLVKDVLKIDIKNKCSISYGKGTKDDYIKVSWHIIVNNGLYFKNMDDTKKATNLLKYNVITNDKYDILRDGVLDFAVYGNNQAFKLPYQSKAFKKIIQKPTKNGSELSEFLLTKIQENPKYYDVSKYANVDVKKKTIKTANGKKMSLNFDEAIIFKEYSQAFGSGFKLGKIEGKKSDGLPYYLNSIPNGKKVSRTIFKMVGWCISNITKNSEEGLKLLTKWTKKYNDDITEDDLRDDFMNNETTKGFRWKTLYNLARVFNKNMDNNTSIFDPLFNDKPTYNCDEKTINSRFIECEEFSMVNTVDKYDIINIKSPMGTGKSYTLAKVFDEKTKSKKIGTRSYNGIEEDIFSDPSIKYKSIVYFSCKRAFASSMISDFKKYGFKNYLDIDDKSTIKDQNRIICSVESIQYCRDKYDIVIIDESESISDNLMGQMFIKNKPIEGATKIYDMITNSPKIMVMDAYLTSRSYDFIKDIYGDDIENKKGFFLKNTFKYAKRDYIEVDKMAFTKQIKKCLDEGKRCAVVCGSKKLSEYVIEQNPNYNIKSYNNKNPLPLSCNVNKEWSECDLLIYTPTITAGISYDVKEVSKQFDTLFIYSVNKGSCHFRDTIQAHKRVRVFKSNVIYICLNDKFKGHPYEIMPLTKDGVEEIEEKYKLQLFEDEVKTLANMEKLSYIYNINIHNKLEFNVSSLCLNGFAKRYLYEENIHPVGTILDETKLELDVEMWDWDDIEDIKYDEKLVIKNMLEDIRVNKPIVEDEKIKAYIKYNYQKEQVKEDIDPTIKREFFNKYYTEPSERKKLGSVRSFKQMLNDIEYDFINFQGWREDKGKEDEMPMEMYDLKLKRYEHLLKFFNKLGFIEEDTINIDKEFVGEDFKILVDDYKNIDVKSLNLMLTDGYLKWKKDELIPELNTKQLKGLFTQLLKDEFGMECVNNGVKYIKVDGKKKKLTKMVIRNFVEKATKKNGLDEKTQDDEAKKWGSSKYNRFNIYKKRFDDVLPVDFIDDALDEETDMETDDEDDEEYEPSSDEETVSALDMGTKGHCISCGKKCLLEKCMSCMMKEDL